MRRSRIASSTSSTWRAAVDKQIDSPTTEGDNRDNLHIFRWSGSRWEHPQPNRSCEAERAGFEPAIPCGIRAFQARALGQLRYLSSCLAALNHRACGLYHNSPCDWKIYAWRPRGFSGFLGWQVLCINVMGSFNLRDTSRLTRFHLNSCPLYPFSAISRFSASSMVELSGFATGKAISHAPRPTLACRQSGSGTGRRERRI